MQFNQTKLLADWSDKESQEAAAALRQLSDTEDETTFETLMDLWKADRPYVRECAKSLKAAGVAEYVKGSRGHPSRIVWTFSPHAIAAAILGKPQQLNALMEDIAAGSGKGVAGFRGKRHWTLPQVLELLVEMTGVETEFLVIEMKIPEVKRMLSLSQGIPERDVDVRMG